MAAMYMYMDLFWDSLVGLMVLFIGANASNLVFKIRDERYYGVYHFAGGFLMTLFLFSVFGDKWLALALAVVTGLLWEVYEWLLWKYFLKKKKYKPQRQDTINDLFLDFLGGLTAVMILFFRGP